jgi:hypothetical protein
MANLAEQQGMAYIGRFLGFNAVEYQKNGEPGFFCVFQFIVDAQPGNNQIQVDEFFVSRDTPHETKSFARELIRKANEIPQFSLCAVKLRKAGRNQCIESISKISDPGK